MKRNVRIILGLILTFSVVLSGCEHIGGIRLNLFHRVLLPQEGVWYCDDLQMQISFLYSEESFAIVNGQKMYCTCYYLTKGSQSFYVEYNDFGFAASSTDTMFLRGECVSLTEREFVVRDIDTDTVYVFTLLPEHDLCSPEAHQWVMYNADGSTETVTEQCSHVVFPLDQMDFHPAGLVKTYRSGDHGGTSVVWSTKNGIEVFRYDQNEPKTDGPHYHLYGDGHFEPGVDVIPEPYGSHYCTPVTEEETTNTEPTA